MNRRTCLNYSSVYHTHNTGRAWQAEIWPCFTDRYITGIVSCVSRQENNGCYVIKLKNRTRLKMTKSPFAKHGHSVLFLGYQCCLLVLKSTWRPSHLSVPAIKNKAISGGFRGGPGARRPYGPKFSQFHAVFCKIWQNCMLAPPLEGWRPLIWGILDSPLAMIQDPGFPGGGGNSQSGCTNLVICNFFAWKWKNLNPGRGGRIPSTSLDTPMMKIGYFTKKW